MTMSTGPEPAPPRLPRVGVCSWSLRPDSPRDLAAKAAAVGVGHVQLALDPLRRGAWEVEETRAALAAADVEVVSGMMAFDGEDYASLESIRRTGGVAPDAAWPANLETARGDAALAERLGLTLVTFHAGFIPHDASDPRRAVLLDRLREVADVYAAAGVTLGLETGQETAATLLAALDDLDRPGVGVNFDPANMLLYGMGDPVEALRRLAGRVRQIHVKDGTPPARPGEWGAETPAGEGAVDWPAFFAVYREAGLACDLVIEREAGEARVADCRRARDLVAAEVGP